MTYPPGSPGYPSAQQPTTQFGSPVQPYGKAAPEAVPAPPGEPVKIVTYLAAAVAGLGLLVYLSSFGPLFTVSNADFPEMMGQASGSTFGLALAVLGSLLAAALAAVGVLPRFRGFVASAAAVAVVSFLLVIAEVITAGTGISFGWALYLVIALTLLQAAAGVVAVLFEGGVLTAPAPRPRFEQPQYEPQPPPYGPYGGPGGYYNTPSGPPQARPEPQRHLPQHQGPQSQQGPQGGPQSSPPPQRGGYPSQYGGGYSSGPSTGGFPSPAAHNGPPTPPTGFPTYGQPQQSSSSAPTTQVPQQPPSQQSGKSSS